MPTWGHFSDAITGTTYSTPDLLAVLVSGRKPDETPWSLNVGSQDAFARLRVSDPITLFDVSHQYDKQPLLVEEVLTGGGTATHNADQSCVDMVVSSSGDAVVRQSRSYMRYQPGKSLLALVTFDAGTADANVRFRAGLFDGANGHYVERSGTAVRVVRRSSVSGSMVDAAVEQASWNIDPLDGTGPSGITLDFSTSQIYWQDQEWLGVGSVRVGFVVDGAFVPVHVFHHANLGSSTYVATATLPVRWELEATGAPSGLPSDGGATTRVALAARLVQIRATVNGWRYDQDARAYIVERGRV